MMVWMHWADEGPRDEAPAVLPDGVTVHAMPILDGARGYGWLEGPTIEDCKGAIEIVRRVADWHFAGERDPSWTPPIVSGARA